MTSSLGISILCLLFHSGSSMTVSYGRDHQAKEPGHSAKADAIAAEENRSRLVKYGERDIVAVRAKIRFTTLIILPKEEDILDFTCGDKEYWVVNGARNFALVKPAKSGSETNLNLITANGNVYSFELREVSGIAGAHHDLKVFVEPRDESILSASSGGPRFVLADEVRNYRELLATARAEVREAKEQAEMLVEERISRFVSEYPVNLKFEYRFTAGKKPFRVTAIYHDDRYTYIRANPRELPAVYEVRDGKPNLVNFDYRNGTFVIAKVVDHGYLAVGKEKMMFVRKE